MLPQPVAFLTRKETFSACHRLHSNHLNDAENLELYGKCNNPNGHGHNYTEKEFWAIISRLRPPGAFLIYLIEVTVHGPISDRTGMVMNIRDLKEAMDSIIFKQLDHKNLDKDVIYFENIPSTTENLAVFIWNGVRRELKYPELLYEVKIHETDKNCVIYRGLYPEQSEQHLFNNKRVVRTSCANNISSDSD